MEKWHWPDGTSLTPIIAHVPLLSLMHWQGRLWAVRVVNTDLGALDSHSKETTYFFLQLSQVLLFVNWSI